MIVVVGGDGRDSGKTSVIEGIIRELAEYQWTAVKITQYTPEEEHVKGPAGALDLETDRDADRDTSRYVRAGAVRSYWLRTPAGEIRAARSGLHQILRSSENVIIESNAVLQLLEPDLFLLVRGDGEEKPGAERVAHLADAVVLTGTKAGPANAATFFAPPPAFTNPELIALVRSKLPG